MSYEFHSLLFNSRSDRGLSQKTRSLRGLSLGSLGPLSVTTAGQVCAERRQARVLTLAGMPSNASLVGSAQVAGMPRGHLANTRSRVINLYYINCGVVGQLHIVQRSYKRPLKPAWNSNSNTTVPLIWNVRDHMLNPHDANSLLGYHYFEDGMHCNAKLSRSWKLGTRLKFKRFSDLKLS